MCDISRQNHITEEDMKKMLPLICKVLFRSLEMSLPAPFDTKAGVLEWIDAAYKGLHKLKRKMIFDEFKLIGKSNEYSLALFTIGCYSPSDLAAIPKAQANPSVVTKSSNPERKTNHESLKKIVKPKTSPTEKSPARSVQKPKTPPSTDSEHIEEEDEWTNSEEISQEEEVEDVESANDEEEILKLKQLITKYKTSDKKLREHIRKLKTQNESLRQHSKRLQLQIKKQSDTKSESTTGSLTSFQPVSGLKQVDDYHNLLSWTFQTPKIASESEIPPPPGNVEKIDLLMKKGDFIQNWRKRLFILTDKLMYYYEEPMKPQGQIDTRTIKKVRESKDPSNLPNTLEILTPQRVWAFSFNNKPQMNEWKAIFEKICQENQARDDALKEKKNLAVKQNLDREQRRSGSSVSSDRSKVVDPWAN